MTTVTVATTNSGSGSLRKALFRVSEDRNLGATVDLRLGLGSSAVNSTVEITRPLAASRRSWTVALIVVVGFNMLSAVGGGIALAASGGLGMPLSLLERSPFDSFTGPGIILAAAVGGTQAIALVLLLVDHRLALAAAAVAAFGMIVWIYVELSMLLFYHWLQTVYFLTGTMQLVIVLILLGVLRASPASSPRP
jgi:hypothetical protein